MYGDMAPVLLRYLYRHPTRLAGAWAQWKAYQQTFEQFAQQLIDLGRYDADEVVRVFHEISLRQFAQQVQRQTRMKGVPPISYTPCAVVLYCLVRLEKPAVVVETGVEHGMSSWLLLEAMERNGKGLLHSIDLPNHEEVVDSAGRVQRNTIPRGHQPGWLIPDRLRSRWTLHLGDAKQLLPQVMDHLKQADFFIHDSLHSYEHMTFEFNAAWPYLRKGGLLLSDDVGWNNSFRDFAAKVGGTPMMFSEPGGAGFHERLGLMVKGSVK
jgi:cephalosporin hydroxylase